MHRSKHGLNRIVRRAAVISLALAVVIGAAWASRVDAEALSSALYGQAAFSTVAFPAAVQADDDEPKETTPQEKFADRMGEYQKEFDTWYEKYQDAEPPERNALMPEYYEIIDKYVGKFRKLAEENRKTPAAAQALLWIIQQGSRSPDGTDLVNDAVERFIADHEDHPQFLRVLAAVPDMTGIDGVAILRGVIEKSDSHDAKGLATYYLAKALVERDSQSGPLSKEQEKKVVAIFEQAKNEYGDVKMRGRTLAEIVEPDLFELLHLSIGKVAPEIEGEDIDAADLKLSDYRGKVVVLDFWGHW